MSTYIPLSAEPIKNQLATFGFQKSYQLHLFDSINSTNTYLKQLPPSQLVDICCAESQTQGRGRFGRVWQAPSLENICCSSRWRFTQDLQALSGLSLVASLAILTTIKHFVESPKLKVKWPNDILWGHKKLCGCLIELLSVSDAKVDVVVGVGLNVNTDTLNQPLSDKAWCSLFEICGYTLDRNTIIALLIKNLDAYFTNFIEHGWRIFEKEWQEHDALLGGLVTVNQGSQSINGLAKGVNSLGALVLENESGLHYLSAGEATLSFAPLE